MALAVRCNNFLIIHEMTRVLTNDDGFCTKEETVFDGKSIGSMLKTENQISL